MRIALGCDHRGLGLKREIMKFLEQSGYDCKDFGCHRAGAVDYPDFARKVGQAVASGKFDRGILICSTGIGMSIAANKIAGIRAALCCDTFAAERARRHNDANVLCLKGERVRVEKSLEIVRTYLSTAFEGGRHIPRLEKIKELEKKSRLSSG